MIVIIIRVILEDLENFQGFESGNSESRVARDFSFARMCVYALFVIVQTMCECRKISKLRYLNNTINSQNKLIDWSMQSG